MKKIIFFVLGLLATGSCFAKSFENEEERFLYNLLGSCVIEEANYSHVNKTTEALFKISEFEFSEIEDKNLLTLLMGASSTEGRAWKHITANKLMLSFATSRPNACAIGFFGAKASDALLESLVTDYQLKLMTSEDQGLQTMKFYAIKSNFKKYGAIMLVESSGSNDLEITSIGYVPPQT
ncbi:exported hypothetical protein [Vibrio crassostreae]|nr:exported hypothetical protein [Vibrio crassostreae]CAK2358532.1 exported hypothetical protein [Vibrio crassostreae]CAK2436193.1 exported hypothetical protein [Vibrio crassostreae]CAK3040595.1 exported hypothetical protein [Vibrio crassostreae]